MLDMAWKPQGPAITGSRVIVINRKHSTVTAPFRYASLPSKLKIGLTKRCTARAQSRDNIILIIITYEHSLRNLQDPVSSPSSNRRTAR